MEEKGPAAAEVGTPTEVERKGLVVVEVGMLAAEL